MDRIPSAASGADVGDGAHHHAGLGEGAAPVVVEEGEVLDGHLGEAEVDDLHLVVGPVHQHQVARLDVAVDDAHVVRRREPGGHVEGHPRRPPRRDGAPVHHGAQRLAAYELLHQEPPAVVELGDLVDGDDVGVEDVLARDGLARKPLDVLGQPLRVGVEDLDRHLLPVGDARRVEHGGEAPVATSASIRVAPSNT